MGNITTKLWLILEVKVLFALIDEYERIEDKTFAEYDCVKYLNAITIIGSNILEHSSPRWRYIIPCSNFESRVLLTLIAE